MSRRQVTRLFAAAISATLLAFGSSTGSAGAVQYEVWSCTDRTSIEAMAAYNWFNVYGIADNECRYGRGLKMDGRNVDPYYPTTWQWSNASLAPIVRVSLEFSGGDTSTGIEYGISSGFYDEPFYKFPARSSTSPPIKIENVPVANLSSFHIGSRCTRAECEPVRDAYVKEIRIAVRDDAPPGVSRPALPDGDFYPTPLNGDPPPHSPEQLIWRRPSILPLRFGAGDQESGVYSMAMRIDGVGKWNTTLECDQGTYVHELGVTAFDDSQVCPDSAESPETLDLSGVNDGVHKFETEAIDAAGHKDVSVSYMGIDGTPPDEPDGILMTGLHGTGEHGWTPIPLARLEWSAFPPQAADDAPIEKYEATMRRVDDASVGVPIPLASDSESSADVEFRSEGLWRMDVVAVDMAGNRSQSARLTLGHDTTAPADPQIAPMPWLRTRDLLDERLQWSQDEDPNVESGICGYRLEIDREESNVVNTDINVDGPVMSTAFPGSLPEGTNFAHLRAVSCAGIGSSTVTVPVRIDDRPPSVRAFGIPSTEWSSDLVDLDVRASDVLSGVESIGLDLGDGEETIADASAIRSLGDGRHTVIAIARDRAGNVSDPQAFAVNVDQTPPVARFASSHGARSPVLAAEVHDPTSGIVDSWIEYRSVGADSWRALSAPRHFANASTSVETFSVSIPDGDLPSGDYEFRVVGVDAAGNMGVGGQHDSGLPLRVSFPLRSATRISAELAEIKRVCSRRSPRTCDDNVLEKGAAVDRLAAWGDRIVVRGRVTDPDGNAMTGRVVVVSELNESATPDELGRVVTGGNGEYQFELPRGASRKLETSALGDSRYLPSSAEARLRVRPTVSLKIDRKTVRAGSSSRFRGSLASGSLGLPEGGKDVVIQFLRGTRWVPTCDVVTTDSRGRFSCRWEWGEVARPTSFLFRAMVKREPGSAWPFETAWSAKVRVKVRP